MEIKKRYNQFYALDQEFSRNGFLNLPKLPPKILLPSQDDLNSRQEQLDLYLKEVVNRQDTRNSNILVQFLSLDQFCPEIIYTPPQLLVSSKFKSNHYVTHSLYVPKFNIYVLAVYDKKDKESCLEVYTFTKIGLIQDSYQLKSSTNGRDSRGSETQGRTSVHEMLQHAGNKQGNSVFEKNRPEARSEYISKPQPDLGESLVQLLAVEQFTKNKIKGLSFCDQLDMLSIGMQNGQVINFTFDIELLGYYDKDQPDSTMALRGKKKAATNNFKLTKEGNELASTVFLQSDQDTPQLDLDRGTWTSGSDNEENKQDTSDKDDLDDFYKESENAQKGPVKKRFKMFSHSYSKIHKKIKQIVLDQNRCYLYSVGEDKIIHCLNLKTKKSMGFLKVSNGQPASMCIDDEKQRLYVGLKEGILVILDISKKDPVMIHYMQLVQNPDPNGKNYVKQMEVDTERNFIICRMKSSRVYCILRLKEDRGNSIHEIVDAYRGKTYDKLHQIKWLSRMNCYCEGTKNGHLKLKDIWEKGVCIMQFDSNFTDQVTWLDYNRKHNVLFGGSKDGRFMVWKVPNEWRQKWVDQKEQDAEVERKLREAKRRRNNK